MAEGWPGTSAPNWQWSVSAGVQLPADPDRAGSSVRTFGFGQGPACGEGILVISLRNI